MPLTLDNGVAKDWQVRKIGVVGPGIVGMPMAAMLAEAEIKEGTEEPARVVIVQRESPTSGWKVRAINSGLSSVRGIEPELDEIVRRTVMQGLLSASHNYADLRDADVVLVCVQTDKKGGEPDYGPLFSSLHELSQALKDKPTGNIPLIVIESTLAPSTMKTLIRDHFASHGLLDGRDVLLGFSPNRVMPGRLVDRVRTSDKLVSGMRPVTPRLIRSLYSRIVTAGVLHKTNTLTAEIVKTTENAYRDVRIAYAAEIARFCDAANINFFQLRDAVNEKLGQSDHASADSISVPSGGLLVPTVGVGGHCLPKDGILLLWRRIEHGDRPANGLIEQARRINDASPRWTIGIAESLLGGLRHQTVAVLGAAYRFNSEDTRNSPSLVLARELVERGVKVVIHDPFVHSTDRNLHRLGLAEHFTHEFEAALSDAEIVIACTAHQEYVNAAPAVASSAPKLRAVMDACNLWSRMDFDSRIKYAGIGRGTTAPEEALVDFVVQGFRIVEHGFARELRDTIEFLNHHYADDKFNTVSYREVQTLAATCSTGCRLAEPIFTNPLQPHREFLPSLVELASGRVISTGA
jgi:UDP-N-acetyl-D-mannosaminuronic acid dehydrogenase